MFFGAGGMLPAPFSFRRLTSRAANAMPHARRQHGFTLIELLMVCIVGALVAGSVSAAMGGLTRQRQLTAARQVQRDVQYARERALATGLRTWVTFTAASDLYEIRAESLTTPGLASATLITDAATGRTFSVRLNQDQYTGVDLVSATFDGQASVGFDYLGRPLRNTGALLSAAGTITLSGSHVITVTPESGAVTLSAP